MSKLRRRVAEITVKDIDLSLSFLGELRVHSGAGAREAEWIAYAAPLSYRFWRA